MTFSFAIRVVIESPIVGLGVESDVVCGEIFGLSLAI